MINQNNIVQITDFGLAVFSGTHSRSYHSNRAPSSFWMAPELLDLDSPRRQSKKSDVYAFGVLCCEVQFYRPPIPLRPLNYNLCYI